MTEAELEEMAEKYYEGFELAGSYSADIKQAFVAGFRAGQKNCGCVHTDNSAVIEQLQRRLICGRIKSR